MTIELNKTKQLLSFITDKVQKCEISTDEDENGNNEIEDDGGS